MSSSSLRWRRRAAVVSVGDSGRTALIDLDDAAHPPRILNGPAAAVWQAVDGERDLTTLCERVAEEFGMTGDEVHRDVVAFLESLAAQGLVEQDLVEQGLAEQETQ